MSKPEIPGQVIESVDLQRHARTKQLGELGGKSFEKWLGEWARRWKNGEQIAVLIDRDSTHAVVIRTEASQADSAPSKETHRSAATTPSPSSPPSSSS